MEDEARRNALTASLDRLPEVLTVPEVAVALRIGKSSAYRFIAERHLGVRIGRRVVVPRRRIEALLEETQRWTKPTRRR